MRKWLSVTTLLALALSAPIEALASESREKFLVPDPTGIPAAYFCLAVFFLSYLFVLTEEKTHMRKSKPSGFIMKSHVDGVVSRRYSSSRDQVTT